MEDYEIYLLIDQYKDSTCNLANVTAVIHELDLQFKSQVVIHARKESGNFKSKLTTKGNNLFGMKLARKRRTLAIGTIYGHAKYTTWVESIIDYWYWQRNKVVKTKDYFVYLKKRKYFCK